MFGMFGGSEAEAEDSKGRLQGAVDGVVEGFGDRGQRRPQNTGVAAVQAFEHAGAKTRGKRKSDNDEVKELMSMFGNRPAWDSSPLRK
jgi:hypothetical protein